ncbi:MAG: LLM class F420-dependent oxidoreductase [Acidimicrobiia bacterium]
MQFGTFIPQGWRIDLAGIPVSSQWQTMVDAAQRAESAGYDSIWVYDHFHTVPEPTQEPTFEAWTLMASLATVTNRVRLGQMCTCNGYRPPSYLAKVAASIDVISGGRVEMGIGGGWYEHEYNAYGYPFPKPSVRLGELDEAVQIMKLMWEEDEASFEGKHYSLDGAICQPKPPQGSIPMWIAGGGEQLTLRTAAKYADYTNFGGTLDSFIHKSEVLAQHCETVGTDFSGITRSVNFNMILGSSQADIDAQKAVLLDRFASVPGIDPQDTLNRWYGGSEAAVGTPDKIVEQLAAYQSAGMGYAIIYFPDAAYTGDSVERFAAEVMPALAG